MSTITHFETAIAKKDEQKKYAQLRCIVPLDEVSFSKEHAPLNFTSCDYLALSKHPFVKIRAKEYLLKWGSGESNVRFTCELLKQTNIVEKKLARLLGFEESILFPSSYLAFSSILAALINSRTHIFVDAACQNTLLQGLKNTTGKIFLFEHNDMTNLKDLLRKSDSSSKIIISESVFIQSGNKASISELIKLSKENHSLLCIEDTHSFGLYGKRGMGLGNHQHGVDLIFGSFGKASGFFGSYLSTSKTLKEYLIKCGSLSFLQTNLPPAVLGAIDAILEIVPDMNYERKKLKEISLCFQKILQGYFPSFKMTNSHIIPLFLNDDTKLFTLHEKLAENNILSILNRKGQNPFAKSSLRFNICVNHSEKDLKVFSEAIKTYL